MAHDATATGDRAARERRYNRAFGIGIVLNVGFVLVELGYGLAADSLALVADAGHNLSDVLSLVLAWAAFAVAEKVPSRRFTYGLRKGTILAALASAVLLLVALGGITWEAFRRIGKPMAVEGTTMIVVAGIGVVVNAITAWFFHGDRRSDLNVRGAFLHMAADAGVSLGVVAGGVLVTATGRGWIDPVLSLSIVAVVLASTWGLLRDSFQLSLDAAPRDLDLDAVERWLREQPGIADLHDLHVWAMSTTQTALTVHVVMPAASGDRHLVDLADGLRREFGIDHVTVQVERAEQVCRMICAQGAAR